MSSARHDAQQPRHAALRAEFDGELGLLAGARRIAAVAETVVQKE